MLSLLITMEQCSSEKRMHSYDITHCCHYIYIFNVLFDSGVLSCQSNTKILFNISVLVRLNIFHIVLCM